MEFATVLSIRQLVIMSQEAAAAVSKPGRGQRAHRVVLARVEHDTLHYQARAGSRGQAVTVKFTAGTKITRVSVQGALDGPRHVLPQRSRSWYKPPIRALPAPGQEKARRLDNTSGKLDRSCPGPAGQRSVAGHRPCIKGSPSCCPGRRRCAGGRAPDSGLN